MFPYLMEIIKSQIQKLSYPQAQTYEENYSKAHGLAQIALIQDKGKNIKGKKRKTHITYRNKDKNDPRFLVSSNLKKKQ